MVEGTGGIQIMHEASIVMSILRIAISTMKDHQDSEIDRIQLSVGKLKAVEPQLLVQSFIALSKGTVCENAQLHCLEIPVTAQCRSCGEQCEIKRFHFKCDACAGSDLKILSGDELKIDKIFAVPVTHPNSLKDQHGK